MLKHFLKSLHIALWSLMGLVLIFCFIVAAMQTKGFKNMARDKLNAWSQEAGIVFTIGSIDGVLPFHWTLNDVHLEIDPQDTLDVKKVNLRLGFFPLLRKEISISYLSFIDSKLLFSEETTQIPSLNLPFTITLKSLKAENIQVEKFETKETGSFTLRAKGKLKKRMRHFLLDLKLSSDLFPNNAIQLFLRGDKKPQWMDAFLNLKIKTMQALRPFIQPKFEADGHLNISFEGDWHTWQSIMSKEENSDLLSCKLNGHLNKLEIPHFKIFNRAWDFTSDFFISSSHALAVSALNVNSNLISLSAHCDLNSAELEFALPELNLLALYFPIPLQGSVKGRAQYSPTSAFFEMNSQNLFIGSQKYDAFSLLAKAKREDDTWKGQAEFLGSNKFLPIIGQSDFSWDSNHTLTIDDFLITAPETKIAATLKWNHQNIDGSMIAQIQNLSPYRVWAPRQSGLEGSVGAVIEFKDQTAKGHFLVKNFHYFQALANEVTVDIDALDIFKDIKGKISVEGDRILMPHVSLSNLAFQANWNGTVGQYDFSMIGEWKDYLELQTRGYWTLDTLQIEDFKGILLKQAFVLQEPFSIYRNDNHFIVSDCDIQFGQGNLSLGLDLNPEFSKGYFKATQFPLDLFLISHPSFALSGRTNIDAFLEGDENNLMGSLDVSLEQFDLYQSGKNVPFSVKGLVHGDLKQKNLHIQTDLKASNDQYMKANVTIPIDYCLFPFHAWFDQNRPLSGDLAFEGHLEELFDFINIGSHQITGNVSSRLLLSNTLQKPSLQGEAIVKNGTYENYYTGTYLKEIDAHIRAQGSFLQLDCFEAKDNQDGSVTATGTLELNPAAHFPYAVEAHLENINLLKLDKATSNLSGILNISGNTQNAMAKGDLTVTKADLTIPDELPADIPIIPVIFINKPAHMDAFTMQPLPIFPFDLDLNLNAPGPVYLRGRGLRTEWRGNAHVTGTNADISASGNLLLTKGEFVFSGKVFTLTSGEIILSNQPTQSAHISIKGELQLPDATVTALLNGPLASPILTFQSTPYMPTSSILSRILFNKDISEISPFQAIQLAQTIVTLSGGAGPDVLEKIRKSIGVDRLNIVTNPGSDEVTVQIGKYLTKGVMVTLSQGFESSQVVVEVELKHGFLLQAETQEVEEGKFSLKWNKNY